jgi:uncharacterized protein (TIGR02996 family)
MATREALEAQIEASPADPAAYLILSDLLQQQHDPRGELIALELVTEHRNRRRAELLARHPELAPPLPSDWHIEWYFGFVRRLAINSHALVGLDVFDHPSLRFLDEVVFLAPGPGAFVELFRAVLERVPRLRSLSIGDPDTRQTWWPVQQSHDLSPLTHLERLYACEPIERLDGQALRTLRLECDTDAFRKLGAMSLPVLESLSVKNGLTRRETAFDQVRWLFERPPPRLVELELVDEPGDPVIEILVGSPLLAQLRRLTLWNAGITETGARHLQRAFGHLELLDVSDPLLEDHVIAMLSNVCREVRTISPWMREILERPG